MDSPDPDRARLLERILAARRRVVVLLGPAAVGKTNAALDFYRHFVDEKTPGGCLLLGPNAASVAAFRRRLLDESPNGIVLAPGVSTFAGLARRILSAAGAAPGSLSVFRRRLLLRRIVDELADNGELGELAGVGDTGGIVVVLDRAISELKRAAIDPETLGKAIGASARRCGDLLTIYRRYQQHLHDSDTYDVEGVMWQARDALAEKDSSAGLDGLAAVAVDGFTDFTPTQLDILRLAGRRMRRVLITLPVSEDGRARMWRWTRRTLNHIRRAFGADLEEIQIPQPANAAGSSPLIAAAGKLFDRSASRTEAPKVLRIVAAPSIDAEVAAAARGVKCLLLGGAAAGDIAVLVRSMDAYREPIERIFAQHDVPTPTWPIPLTDVPIIRYVLNVASLGGEFAFRDVLGVIKSSYFRPGALGALGQETAATAEMLIREGDVLRGRGAYAAAAERFAQRSRTDREDEDEDENFQLGAVSASPRLVTDAAAMLEKLFDLAESVSGHQGLGELIDALEVDAAACEHGEAELIARDLRSLSALRGALTDLAGSGCRAAQLREALSAVACPPSRRESLVDVMDVLDARALRYRHVLLLGVCQGRFPYRFNDGALICEADRIAWASRGAQLDSRSDLTAREMLLFYLAVSRADESLTVSYVESDDRGAAMAPSSFLLALVEPFGGLAENSANRGDAMAPSSFLLSPVEPFGGLAKNSADRDGVHPHRIPAGQLVGPPGESTSRRDALTDAVAGLFADEYDPHGTSLSWAAAAARGPLARAAAGLWTQYHRWRVGQCGAYDGRIGDAQLLTTLAERYPAAAVFSASQLNAYAQCPWRYFAKYVLRLAPLAEPQRRLEAQTRGTFCHDVLFDVMTDLRDRFGPEVRLRQIDFQAIEEALSTAVATRSEEVVSRQPPYPQLWEIQRRQMHEQMREYLRDSAENDDPPPCGVAFELGFGMNRTVSSPTDPAPRREPVAIKTPAGAVRFGGKIDRVDRVELDGVQGMLVVDYKTGSSLPTSGDIAAGRNLQLPIYTEIAGQLLGAQCFGGVFHGVVSRKRSGFSEFKKPQKDKRDFAQRRDAAIKQIGAFVSAMRNGRFDLLPTHKCPSWCPFGQICHYSTVRAQRKTPPGSTEGDE